MNDIPDASPLSSLMVENLSSMDLETALLTVQTERTRLLDVQLAEQIRTVQIQNERIARLNDVLVALNRFASQINGSDAGDTPTNKNWTDQKVADYEIPLNDALREAGITDLGFSSTHKYQRPAFMGMATWIDPDIPSSPHADDKQWAAYDHKNRRYSEGQRSALDAQGHPTGAIEYAHGKDMVNCRTTKGQVETAKTKVKGMIDAAGNSQQQDMLRLQSLSNKRNEAFDVMSSFVKKSHDSRGAIIGNLR